MYTCARVMTMSFFSINNQGMSFLFLLQFTVL